MAIQKKPPQEPDILYERDIKELTLQNAREILCPEHLKVFENMMKKIYAEGFLNGQKSMITAIVLLLTTICFSQTYVKSVKLSSVLTTTMASNPGVYKQNIFELKECKDNTDALAKNVKVNQYYKLPMKDNVVLIAIVVEPVPITTGTIENQTSYMSKEK